MRQESIQIVANKTRNSDNRIFRDLHNTSASATDPTTGLNDVEIRLRKNRSVTIIFMTSTGFPNRVFLGKWVVKKAQGTPAIYFTMDEVVEVRKAKYGARVD